MLNLPLGLIYNAVGLPMFMRILPKDRFGQFCSFNAVCQAVVEVAAGVAAGLYMDRNWKTLGGDTHYVPPDSE